MITPGSRPIVTWMSMALSTIAAFVLPAFSVDPVQGAKPLRFVLPTIGLGFLGAVLAAFQGRRGWALVSGVWGFVMLVAVFLAAALGEWAMGGPHL